MEPESLPPTRTANQLPRRDLRWEFHRSPGPGGQRKNKVLSAVRLTHLPSGITVAASERRSRSQNMKAALVRLLARLAERERPRKARRPTSPTKASRQRRLADKRVRSRQKALRARPPAE